MRLNKNALKKTAWTTGEIKEEKGRGRCNKALKHPQKTCAAQEPACNKS